jgi:N-acetylglucosamine-6-phosphate deacetylase
MTARRVYEAESGWRNISGQETSRYSWVPGLIDIHVHGVAGLDVMEGDAAAIAKELRERGIEWFCATTVAADWKSIESVFSSIEGVEGCAGVHLEGPYINPEMCGAQPAAYIAPFAKEQIEPFLGHLKILTLAPELPGAAELGEWLVAKGVIVSAGHTNADFETLRNAHAVSQMTHFFNAMRPFHHRCPGCIDFGLIADVHCELIYDRVHVSKEAATMLFACKGPGKVIGISDGTKLSGCPDGSSATMWGHEVFVRDGSARLADGTLAGSSSTLASVFQALWQDIGPEAAIMACSVNPRNRLGLDEPELWLLVDEDGGIVQVTEGRTPPIE